MRLIKSLNSRTDDTVKYQFVTKDNHMIEACVVFFDLEKASVNICVSNQVGCMCQCAFCATGSRGFVRNLNVDEIKFQVESILSQLSYKKNDYYFEITYMGTGEPLYNFENVINSAKVFSSHYSNLVRINISTVFPDIYNNYQLIQDVQCPVHFQYSMHFCTDNMREKYIGKHLLPISRALKELERISTKYDDKFCVNYILFQDLNDSIVDAQELINLLKPFNAYLKISEYCPIDNGILKKSNNKDSFISRIKNSHIQYKTFTSKGIDIKAACGHLISDVFF